ncbi:signal peptidase I [Arthrobacter tumbae]|uniref:signal peptidase I n=1 Tax=Arthrobacter tumbae TaxID=163874 RepID=UPI0027DAF595|nr:signal peptidase I [Arthrobacter tumbae]MBM7779956.1 signal peptidase I [Arthrobacter tumbae]
MAHSTIEKHGAIPLRVAVVLVCCLAALLALRIWVLEPLIVASDSMEPTVPEGSTVLLLKSPSFEAGSLVSFRSPIDDALTLKRVVAVAGQTVAFEDALLVIDGREIPEPFVDHSRIDGTYFGPVTVPAGHVFVLGDNRGRSIDSRDFGAIPVHSIEATVLWPSP